MAAMNAEVVAEVEIEITREILREVALETEEDLQVVVETEVTVEALLHLVKVAEIVIEMITKHIADPRRFVRDCWKLLMLGGDISSR